MLVKPLAYPYPLLMLPFDHRSSFSKELLGFSGTLTDSQHTKISHFKHVVYEGFLRSAHKPAMWYSILADDEYASGVLADAAKRGYTTAMPVEKSGQPEFAFDHDDWRKRIELHNPSIVKVLVRYNPTGDAALNKRQLAKLKELGGFCKKRGTPLLFELLVPPTDEQKQAYGERYDNDLRPQLMAQAIKEIRAKVHVVIWKIEGLEKDQWKPVIAAANTPTRKDAPVFIVLGRNAPVSTVEHWLRAAAAHEQVVGFAVGRTVFYEPLEAYRDGKLSRDHAAQRIADAFEHFTHVWMRAKKLE
jgi:myo-inositol catabolism protein IolC